MFRSTSTNLAWPPPPPANEDENAKTTRLEAEREAKRISDEIDHALEQERQEIRKRRPQTKVLLLGQSESGKSTMVKNFQLKFCPAAFHAEAEAWRTVIHLNLARYVNYILEALATAAGGRGPPDKVNRVLQMRLSPLKHVEVILTRAISGEPAGVSSPIGEKLPSFPGRSTDVCIRGGSAWKSLVRGRESLESLSEFAPRSSIVVDELADARRILDACKDDIVALWKNHACSKSCSKYDMDHARYFLNNAARVADIKYTPTVEDILRARLRTVGVEEYRMPMETSMEKGAEWLFYDVGGARSQRAAWASYFEDVNAVLFLCPISSFDQQLEEDALVNRLTDSLDLWTTVCKSKLLENAIFILLLNKADLLRAKLKAGIMFEDHITSYRGRPNKIEHVGEYLRERMKTAHRSYSPKKRPLHVHVTCAIDTTLMSEVLNDIRDCILISVLRQTTFL